MGEFAALALVLLSAALPAHAGEVVSKAADRVSITIYRDGPVSTWDLTHRPAWMTAGGLAFIVETRTVVLPAGRSTLRFEGVSDQIAPQTAEVDGLPARAVERNFDYNLLSPGSLVAKSLGQEVELVDTDRKTGKASLRRAVLRSGPNGVMLDVDGKVEAFKCDLVPERMVFDRVPEGLSDKPTLSVKVDAPKAGRHVVRLSYLATGFNWSSDYVARVRPDGKTLDLQGWITLANESAESFRNAPTQVVAGRVALTGDDRAVAVAAIVRREQCWNRKPAWWTQSLDQMATQKNFRGRGEELAARAGGAMLMAPASAALPQPPPPPPPMAKEEDFGDYKLYTLPEPTTVAARQTKQVLFLAKAAVPFERTYRYTVSPGGRELGPQPAAIVLKLKNTEAGGLGLALPQGTVSLREPDAAGALLFAGEARLDDTPKGLPVKLTVGAAPSVLASQRVVAQEDIPGGVRTTWEVSVVNGSSRPATVEVVHPAQGRGFAVAEGAPPHETDAGSPKWTLTVPPDGREVLTYSVVVDR